MQSVARRDEATLLPLTQQFVRPGSTVYSNAWAAYNNLGQHGYAPGVVMHQEKFLDPMTGVHTQNIEAYWSRAKHKIKSVYGSRLHLIPSYLDEFMWRERFGLGGCQTPVRHLTTFSFILRNTISAIPDFIYA